MLTYAQRQQILTIAKHIIGSDNMFCKEVDKRYRKAKIAFLKKHFRYHTMNSWNRSTSYANCIKLYNIDKPDDVDNDTWWEMLCNVELNITKLMLSSY